MPALFAERERVLFADRLSQDEALPWLFALAFYLWSLLAGTVCLPAMAGPRRIAQGSLGGQDGT